MKNFLKIKQKWEMLQLIEIILSWSSKTEKDYILKDGALVLLLVPFKGKNGRKCNAQSPAF